MPLSSASLEILLLEIAEAYVNDEVEGEKDLADLKALAKAEGISARTVDRQFKPILAGVRDTLRKSQRALRGMRVVGGTEHGDPPAVDERPTFDVNVPKRADVIEDVQKLLGGGLLAYDYGGMSMVIEMHSVVGSGKRARLTPMNSATARRHVEAVCHWQAFEARTLDYVPRPAPDWCLSDLPNLGPEHYPPLAGVISHPVLTPSGEFICDCSGYNPETCYFMGSPDLDGDVSGWRWEGPQEAFAWLVDEWLGEFPFATRGDAVRALMLPLTLLVGRTCLATRGKYPAFMLTAPSASSGKTQLARVLAAAVTGEDPVLGKAPPEKPEEMEKVLVSISKGDRPVHVFDNLRNGATLQSADLDAFVTNRTFAARLLGANDLMDLPALSLIVVTGNNIEAVEDSRSRFLEVRLSPDDASPQNRIFSRDITEWTRANRARILSALVEVARGAPTGKPMGRFPEWWRRVAGPLAAASGEDGLLDAWSEDALSVRNASGLEAFLRRLAEIQSQGREGGLLAKEVATEMLDELHDLVHLPREDFDLATSLLDPDMPEGAQDKAWKAVQGARKRIAGAVVQRLRKWRDQQVGGLRLRFVKSVGEDRHPAIKIHAEKVERPASSQPAPTAPGQEEIPF